MDGYRLLAERLRDEDEKAWLKKHLIMTKDGLFLSMMSTRPPHLERHTIFKM